MAQCIRILFGYIAIIYLAGCSPTPPIIEAKKVEIDEIKAEDWKILPKPDKSDEAAAKLLKECLAAHTRGKPESIERLKLLKFERKGQVKYIDASWYQTQWIGHIQWPTRYSVEFGVRGLQMGRVVQCRFVDNACYDNSSGKLAKSQDTLTTDTRLQMYEDGVLYLMMLADPQVMVTSGKDEVVNNEETFRLNVWTNQIEYLQLHINKKTKQIAKFRYLGSDDGLKCVKDVLVTGYKDIDGIQLPEKYTVMINGNQKAIYDGLTAEMVKSFEPKVFATE